MKYNVQSFVFEGRQTHRILQNVGGPCPLIGICNVLLLRGEIRVQPHITSVAFEDLTFCLRDHLQRIISNGDLTNETETATKIQNMEDCIALFPKLEEGLDINTVFSSSASFEFTPQVAMFDSYSIRLRHGWVVDPQDRKLFELIAEKSYNEVVDLLTSDKEEDDHECVRAFLEDNKQQLTAFGLTQMNEMFNENELGIFFHNNHFATMTKRRGNLYVLVTDEGIVSADPRIVWTTLTSLSGDDQFLGADFSVIPPLPEAPKKPVQQPAQGQVSAPPQYPPQPRPGVVPPQPTYPMHQHQQQQQGFAPVMYPPKQNPPPAGYVPHQQPVPVQQHAVPPANAYHQQRYTQPPPQQQPQQRVAQPTADDVALSRELGIAPEDAAALRRENDEAIQQMRNPNPQPPPQMPPPRGGRRGQFSNQRRRPPPPKDDCRIL